MVGVEGCVHQVVQPWYLPRQNRIVAKRYEDLIQLVGRPLQRMMKQAGFVAMLGFHT